METNKYTILVTDDEEKIRLELEGTLTEDPRYKVVCASSGREAVDYAYNHHTDLMILDFMMPGMSGREVIRLVREFDKRLPIIMLTANAETGNHADNMNAGANDYLLKPHDPDILLAHVNRQLEIANATIDTIIKFGPYTFDTFSHQVSGKGFEPFRLTPITARIIEVLARNTHRYMTASAIQMAVYNDANGIQTDSLRRNVDRLNEIFLENVNRKIVNREGERGYELILN